MMSAAMFSIPSFPSVANIGLATYEIRVQVTLGQYFTLTDPYLDADLSIYRQSEYIGIIDIHTKGMQWRTALFDLLGTGNFRTAQTTGHFYLYSFRAHTKGRSDRHLDGDRFGPSYGRGRNKDKSGRSSGRF